MSISEVTKSRGITELLHFTTNRGLVGILASGALRSRRGLNSDDYLKNVLHKNAIVRPEEAQNFDKQEDWLDYVNLSISAINTSYMGFSQRWPHNQEIWWAILSFSADLLDHEGVYFATTNNAYEHCRRAVGEEGLEALFARSIRRKEAWTAWRGSRADHLPSCQQAEVLYPGSVSVDYLKHVYVQSDEDSDRVRGWLRELGPTGVGVSVSTDVFRGFPN